MTSMNPGTKVACMPVEAMCQLKGGSEMVNRISGKALLLVIFCISMSLLLSCAGKKRVRRSLPEGFNHHLKQAILYYDEGQCEKAIPEFDKVIYKADKLKEQLKDLVIMLQTINNRIPGRTKYKVLRYVRKGIIEPDNLEGDLWQLAKLFLQAFF